MSRSPVQARLSDAQLADKLRGAAEWMRGKAKDANLIKQSIAEVCEIAASRLASPPADTPSPAPDLSDEAVYLYSLPVDEFERLAQSVGINNRRYMTTPDYAIWRDTQTRFVAAAIRAARTAETQAVHGEPAASGVQPSAEPVRKSSMLAFDAACYGGDWPERTARPVDDDAFVKRTNEGYAAWCRIFYTAETLDHRGMKSLDGLWAWQAQERRLGRAAAPAEQEGVREALTEAAPDAEPVAWRDMATAPTDGTLVRLLVEFDNHSIEDTNEPNPTIGHCCDGEWNIVGWDWHTDQWTRGGGGFLGWLPMLDDATKPAALSEGETE